MTQFRSPVVETSYMEKTRRQSRTTNAKVRYTRKDEAIVGCALFSHRQNSQNTQHQKRNREDSQHQ
jgi:hypothetical protein